MTSPLITIVIPTFRRPDSLARLLASIQSDDQVHDNIAVVIVDNDHAASARNVVDRFVINSDLKIRYHVEPNPGVSNARNAGMSHVASQYVLFLDDDMEIVPPFLGPLLETSRSLGTAITFAKIDAALPSECDNNAPWLAPLFSRHHGGPSRVIDTVYGTGGCLLDLSLIALPDPVFDPDLNDIGGEDDALFQTLLRQGATVGWCDDATALEHVPLHRTAPDYLWKRHFAYGQTPTHQAARKGPSGWLFVAMWMLIGAAQFTLHGLVFLGLRLMRHPSRLMHFGRMAQGAGKVLWWDGLSPRFYGASAQ